MIITVSRELGAGGGEVARRVASALGWRLVDNELVDQVAARSGLPREEVAEREERAPGFVDRLIRMASRAVPELFPAAGELPEPERDEATLVRCTESIVAELADEGRVVLVGRAASAVLGQDRDALHVRIVAPRADRIAAVARARGVDPEGAAQLIDESDRNRERYHRQHYRRDWRDATSYHFVLNTGAIGLDGAVRMIVEQARALWPAAPDGRGDATRA